jgi:hypothetical protein
VNSFVPVGHGVLVGVCDGGGVCDRVGDGVIGTVAVRTGDIDFVGDLEIVSVDVGIAAQTSAGRTTCHSDVTWFSAQTVVVASVLVMPLFP